MKFYLDEQEWDVAKPVYVLGYTVKSWFPFDSNKINEYEIKNVDGKLFYQYGYDLFPISCKKVYIHFIEVKQDSKSGRVKSFKTTTPSNYPWSPFDYQRNIIGMTQKRAMDRLKKMLQVEGE